MDIRRIACVVLAALVAACTYAGGDDPLRRTLSWFSYLNGDDLRRACRAGAPDAYRFVYNGIYQEQIRTYDVAQRADRTGARLRVRVIGPADLGSIRLSVPGGLLDPWNGRNEVVNLRPQDLGLLRTAAATSGAFGPSPQWMRLGSEDFYWLSAACVDGAFHFNAFKWPSERFDALAFPAVLRAWDFTGIAINPPRAFDLHRLCPGESDSEIRDRARFELTVRDGGLGGVRPLF